MINAVILLNDDVDNYSDYGPNSRKTPQLFKS